MCRSQVDCQVLIIGAGPAGTAAAGHLQKNGISVCLCDRAVFPRSKSCGGLLEEQAFRAIEHTAPDSLIARFPEIAIRMPRGVLERVPSPIVLIDRVRFDLNRLQYCRKLGVSVREGSAAASIRQDRDRVITTFTEGREIVSGAVIATDGSASLVRRKLDLPRCASGVTMQAEIPAGSARPPWPLVHFLEGHPGYAWIFPAGDRLNVGVYSLDYRGIKTAFRELLDRYGLPQHSGKGSFVQLCQGPALAGRGRILLAGDAAGLANPLTGGGIQAALYSGRAAALSLLAKGEEQALPHYQRLLARLSERSFSQMAFARLFYQNTTQYQAYRDCLASVREFFAADPNN